MTHSWDDSVSFSTPELCRLTGITYRQADYWARTDLIAPSLAVGNGSGTQRRYSQADLRAVQIIKQLLDVGLSLQRCRTIADALYRLPAEFDGYLLLVGDAVEVAETAVDLMEHLLAGQVAQIVRVGAPVAVS